MLNFHGLQKQLLPSTSRILRAAALHNVDSIGCALWLRAVRTEIVPSWSVRSGQDASCGHWTRCMAEIADRYSTLLEGAQSPATTIYRLLSVGCIAEAIDS